MGSSCLSAGEIAKLVSGSMDPGHTSVAVLHIAECDRCRKEMRDLQNSRGLTRDVEMSPPSGSTPTRTEARFDGDIPGYEVYEEIHRGGQGVVYKALQKRTKRTVAVKVLLHGRYASPRQHHRFEREIDLVANLHHLNIVTVYDSGVTADGHPYYAMEYIHGKPLDHYVERRKLSVEGTLRLFLKICQAISHAHLRGVIHRDLKPANIIVDSGGEPRIVDFGLAKVAGTSILADGSPATVTGEFMGTLAYSSPEQVTGDPQRIDLRSDVYSLGVILYEMLTGKYPYPIAADIAETLRNITDADATRPSTYRSEIGDEVETIILKALSKERLRRYQSAEELARDVRRYLDGEPIEAKRDSGLYLLRKTLSRYRAPVTVGVLFLLLVMASTVGLFILYHRQRRAREVADVKSKEAEQALKRAEEARTLLSEQADALRKTLYANRIALADAAYRDGNVTRLEELLKNCDEELVGWEWQRLERLSQLYRVTVEAHAGSLSAIAISPDGTRVASAGAEPVVKLWDAATGELVLKLHGHHHNITALAFSPTGRYLASGSQGGVVKIWQRRNEQDPREVHSIKAHIGPVVDLAFSGDGALLASASSEGGGPGGVVYTWETRSGKQRHGFQRIFGPATDLDLDHEGNHLVSAGFSSRIELWNLTDGSAKTLDGHNGPVRDVRFNHDGTRIVSAGEDHTVRIWSTMTGEVLQILRGHRGPVNAARFAGEGEHVVSGGHDRTVRVWNPASGRLETGFRGHRTPVRGVAVSADGAVIVSGGESGNFRVWEIETKEDVQVSLLPRSVTNPQRRIHSLDFSPDGRRLAVGTDPVFAFMRRVPYNLRLLDSRSGQSVLTAKGQLAVVGANPAVLSVSYRPDGSRIATAAAENRVRIWDAETGREIEQIEHPSLVTSAKYSADGRRLITGGRTAEGVVWGRLWEISGGSYRELHHFVGRPEGRLAALALSVDGERVLVAGPEWVHVWEASSGDVLTARQEPGGHAQFTPDGRGIITRHGGGFQIWDATTGKKVRSLPGPGERVDCFRLSPDGRRFVVGGVSGQIKVYDARTGDELLTLDGHASPIRSLTFSADGNRIASGDENGEVRIWTGRAD